MKNMNLKAVLYSFVPFFAFGTYLLVEFKIPALAYFVIVACGFLVPLYFSKDVEEVTIKGFTLVKRFRKDFDKDLKEHADTLIKRSLATVDEKVTDAVGEKLVVVTGTTMYLQQEVQSLQQQIRSLELQNNQPRRETFFVRPGQCPHCCSTNLYEDGLGIRCGTCCKYVCQYNSSLC